MTLDLAGVRVIDADTHLTERHDLWTKRAPARLKDRVPHVTQVDGGATWVVDGAVLGRAGAGGVVDRRRRRRVARSKASTSGRSKRSTRRAYDPVARIELLDEIGIWAQIIFPGVVGLGGQSLAEVVQDQALRTLCVRDLQRRQRRAAGRIGQPASCPWRSCRHGTWTPASREAKRAAGWDCAGST